MTSLFPKQMKRTPASKLETVTLHGFSGGWNAVHDDLSMAPRFLVTAKNVRRTASGASKIRFGSKWFADGSDVATGTYIVDCEYFNTRIVSVTNTGQIFTTNEDGEKVLIWSDAIAALLPGTPDGWNNTFTTIDFVPFRNKLIIHNGIDKPLIVANDFTVTYLQDEATGSNVNTPIGKYGCVVSNFHCIAGISGSPTVIYIGSKGTSGTFPGDTAPNDSISIDVGAYAPSGSAEIRGIAGFRTNLIVFFQSQALVITLGGYVDDVHTPVFPDTMPKFGLLGHRCIVELANDLQFADLHGVASAKRNLFSNVLDSKHLSEYIQPAYRRDISTLTDTQQRENCFSLYDSLAHTTNIFTSDGRVFVYSHDDDLNYRGWSEYEDMDWRCGCSSFLGRSFVASGMKLFQLGNDVFTDEDYSADRVNDHDADWANDTLYVSGALVYDTTTEITYQALVGHRSALTPTTFAEAREADPTYWEVYTGESIAWEMELPWFEGRDRMKTKHLRFMSIATKGTARFTVEIYVDNVFDIDYETTAQLVDSDDALIIDNDDAVLLDSVIATVDPALSIEFIGNDAQGFGYDAGPFGGGRRSNDPRLYKTPCKFKSMKIKIKGDDIEPLTIATASFLYSRGRYKRA
jgi:hypothetical protein